MQPENIVTIFEFPIDESKPEGDARLIRCVDRNAGHFDGRTLQRWQVQFVDGPDTEETFERVILV